MTVSAAIGSVSLLLLAVGCYAIGARINITKSLPMGLYWTSSKPVTKGSYVLFCPPLTDVFSQAKKWGYIGAGFCPGGYGYLMKRVLAAQGDTVLITDGGVYVNDILLPFSAPVKADKAGRWLPHYPTERFTLKHSEVLLMSDVSSTSFDSRYFGPVNRSQIKTVIFPIVVW